jgi:hypothetical protein
VKLPPRAKRDLEQGGENVDAIPISRLAQLLFLRRRPSLFEPRRHSIGLGRRAA